MEEQEQQFTVELTFRMSGSDQGEVDEMAGKIASDCAERFKMDEVSHQVRPTSLDEATQDQMREVH